MTAREAEARGVLAGVTVAAGCWLLPEDAGDPDERAREVHGLLRGALADDANLIVRCGNPRCVRPDIEHRVRDDSNRYDLRARPA